MSRRRRHPGPHACRHCFRVRLLGQEFRWWRESWERACEGAGAGYPEETTTYRAEHTPPTFGAFLVAMTGQGWPMSGRPPGRQTWAA